MQSYQNCLPHDKNKRYMGQVAVFSSNPGEKPGLLILLKDIITRLSTKQEKDANLAHGHSYSK